MIKYVETTKGSAPEGVSEDLMKVIEDASIRYTYSQGGPNCIAGDRFRELAHDWNRNHAFEAGVIWALQNTDKLQTLQDSFPTSHIHIDDIQSEGYDTSDITLETMHDISNIMNDLYLNYGFWENLDYACEKLKIPKLKEDDE